MVKVIISYCIAYFLRFKIKLKEGVNQKMIKDTIKLVITQSDVDEYEKLYFKQHPKAKKRPIKEPNHPSLNAWTDLHRLKKNTLKQNWSAFIVWFVEKYGFSNINIKVCDMEFTSFFKTQIRHDNDNTCPKWTLDGLSESGMILDDDSKTIESLLLKCGYDKENPRTEILIKNIII